MGLALIELPSALVRIDQNRAAVPDDGFIQEHLTYYCSKFDPLPTITVRISGDDVYVMQGHKYLIAAAALGRSRMRAIVDPASAEDATGRLLGRSDVRHLDWAEIERAEAEDPVPVAWHVVFFQRGLTTEEGSAFSSAVADLARSTSARPVRVAFDESGTRAEFQLATPVFDRDWATNLLRMLHEFHRTRVPLLSYQGRAFPG